MRASAALRLPATPAGGRCGGGCKDGAGTWSGREGTCGGMRSARGAGVSCGSDGGCGGGGDVECYGAWRSRCSHIPHRRTDTQEVLRAARSDVGLPARVSCRTPCDESPKKSELSTSTTPILELLMPPGEGYMRTQPLLEQDEQEEEEEIHLPKNICFESDYRNEETTEIDTLPSSPPVVFFASRSEPGGLHSLAEPKLSAHSKACEAARQAILAGRKDLAVLPRRPGHLAGPVSPRTPHVGRRQRKKSEEKRSPEKDSSSDLQKAMYDMVTWTEEERDFRERHVCFCQKVLEVPWCVTFSEALKMGLETSILRSFLRYLNKKSKNTQDVNVDRLDMVAMNIADKRFREILDKLDEKSLEERSNSTKDSLKSQSTNLDSERGSKKKSNVSEDSSSPLKTSKKRKEIAKKSKKHFKANRRNWKEYNRNEINKNTGKKSPTSAETWARRSEDSEEEEKEMEGEEGELEEESRPRGLRWAEPRLGDTLQALFRPSQLLFSEQSDVQDFIISPDLLLLVDQMNKEDVPYTRENVLQRLCRLRLINYDMTELDEGVQRLKQLRVLSLASNWLKELHGELLPRGLKFLELYSNLISDVEPLTNNMPRCLLYLGLARNRINDSSNLQLLATNTSMQLRCLDLGDNDIVELQGTLQALRGLRHLQALRLHGNPCSTSLGYSDLTLLLLPSLQYLDDVRVWPGDRRVVKDGLRPGDSATQSAYSDVVSYINRIIESVTTTASKGVSSNTGSQVSSQGKIQFSSSQHKPDNPLHSRIQSENHDLSQIVLDAPVKSNTNKLRFEEKQFYIPRELDNSATRGVLIATVVRVMGLPVPPEEFFRGKALKQLFTVELEAPLLDPVVRQPLVEEEEEKEADVSSPSPPSPPKAPSPSKVHSPSQAPTPPPTPDGGENLHDGVNSSDNNRHTPSPKKGKRKKKLPDVSDKRKKSNGKIRKKGKERIKKKVTKSIENRDSTFDDEEKEEEERMLLPPPGFEGVEDPPGKGRPLTRYSTPPSPWMPEIRLDHAPIRLEAPEGDLTALRDTMRSCVTMRLMFTRVLPKDRSSIKKSKKDERGNKSKGKSKIKSPKKKAKNKSKIQSSSVKIEHMDGDTKVSHSLTLLQSGVSSTILEGIGTVLSRSTLAIFDVPLHQPLWTDNAVEYTWNAENGNLAIPFTEGLENLHFDSKSTQRSRTASKDNKSERSSESRSRSKKKKGKKEKKSKNKKNKKNKDKGSKGTKGLKSESPVRTSQPNSSGFGRSVLNSKESSLPQPSGPTVHITFSLERLSPVRQTLPEREHDAWVARSGSLEEARSARKRALSPPPPVPPPSFAAPFFSGKTSVTAIATSDAAPYHSAAPPPPPF